MSEQTFDDAWKALEKLVAEIEDETIKKTESEMTLMYSQLIDLFHNLQKRIGEK